MKCLHCGNTTKKAPCGLYCCVEHCYACYTAEQCCDDISPHDFKAIRNSMIVVDYKRHMSIEDIVAKHNISTSTLYYALKDNHIKANR